MTKNIYRPGPGWKHVAGAVWDHVSGIRLHVGGLVHLADGRIIYASRWPHSADAGRAVRVAGGNRQRGLMVWALWEANRGVVAVSRLRAIGNGQVPPVVAKAWRILMEGR